MIAATVRQFVCKVFSLGDVHHVSEDWRRQREREDARIEFHGVSWTWPVNRRVNEAGTFNRHRLRRRA